MTCELRVAFADQCRRPSPAVRRCVDEVLDTFQLGESGEKVCHHWNLHNGGYESAGSQQFREDFHEHADCEPNYMEATPPGMCLSQPLARKVSTRVVHLRVLYIYACCAIFERISAAKSWTAV
jgi:hypothetical protein